MMEDRRREEGGGRREESSRKKWRVTEGRRKMSVMVVCTSRMRWKGFSGLCLSLTTMFVWGC